MKNNKLTFLDFVFIDVYKNFDDEGRRALELLLEKHGTHRFEAALINTYKKDCFKHDGLLEDEKIRNKFIPHVRERLRYYSSEMAINALEQTIEYLANHFGGIHTSEINDLMQRFLVFFKDKKYSDRKIVNKFNELKTDAHRAISFYTWLDNTKKLLA